MYDLLTLGLGIALQIAPAQLFPSVVVGSLRHSEDERARERPPPKMTGPSLKKLTQEQFDAAVDDMMDGLGLEPEEAIESAVEEFEMQGYKLDGIIKEVGGANKLKELPTAVAAEALKEETAREGRTVDSVRTSVLGLKSALDEAASGDNESQLLLASAKSDGVESLFSACDFAEAKEDKELLVTSLETLKRQLESDCARDHFVESEGPRRMVRLLETWKAPEDEAGAALVLKISALSMKEQEEGKCGYMSEGLPTVLASYLEGESTEAKTLEACCSCVQGILTTDDTRPTPLALEAQFGGEFMKALSMDKDGVAVGLMVSFRRRLQRLGAAATATDQGTGAVDVSEERGVLRDLAVALRKISLNDDICKKFVEEHDLIRAFLSILKTTAQGKVKAKDLTMSVLALLKQISACDTVKKNLVESEAIEIAIEMFDEYEDNTIVIQSLLYILTNITLRNPDVAEHFADSGGFDFVLKFIARYLDKPKLMKQVCMFLRTAAVRSDKVKTLLRKAEMEKHVRAIQSQHQKTCSDVASAALRDMGIDNYN